MDPRGCTTSSRKWLEVRGDRQTGLGHDLCAPLFAPGSAGVELALGLVSCGDELVVTKSVAGAFSKTRLHERLASLGVEQLVVAGLMTHLAVDTTAR